MPAQHFGVRIASRCFKRMNAKNDGFGLDFAMCLLKPIVKK